MKIVIASDSFKESLSADAVCEAIARGVRRARPNAVIESIPMADGGEGTVETLIAATGGRLSHTTVTGPEGTPVLAAWGRLGTDEQIAVLEMASASGLALVPPQRRNPMLTTTFGTGELIRGAVSAGATQILIGIGGSATNDGGTGAAQACGVEFFDSDGRLCPNGLAGGALADITRIEIGQRLPQIARARIRVACDVDNPLCGPRGAAAIYGPQKGATPEQVERLDRDLSHLADLIERDLGKQVRDVSGAGAAGGLGAGLIAFFDATLIPGVRLVMDALHFDERIADADLIITGEGRLDRQSMMGKVIEGVGLTGRAAGVPVVALVGSLGDGADDALEVLESYHCINPPDAPITDALAQAARRLEESAHQLLQTRNP